MKNKSERCLPIGMCMGVVLLALLVLPMAGWAIPFSETNKWAWAESAGYLNFRATNAVALTATAHVDGENGYLTGWAWSEMLGWIKLGNTDGGVPYANTDSTNWGVNVAGALVSGFAWSESAGWINFAPTNATMTNRVTFSAATWQFDGYAWSELAGWVHVRGDGETPLYALDTEPALAVLGVLGTNGSAIESSASFQLANGSKFAPALAGSTQTHTFSITNSGNDTLELGTYGTNGTDAAYFEISGVPASVAAGEVSAFTVAYTPEAVGSHTATVSFASNDPDSPYLLNLGGSCFEVSTDVGPYGGGNTITITNGNFGAITNVLVGGVAATIVDWDTDWVTVVMPAAAGVGSVDIVVQSSDNGDITLADAYTYNPAGWIADGWGTQAFTIGSGMATNHIMSPGPINIYYQSRHFQFVYTTNDLADAGLVGPVEIVALGLDVVEAPDYNLPSFQIRMKHTMANDMSGGFESAGLEDCYNNASYAPAAGGFDMLAFAQPFTWNGTNNLIIDTAFAPAASYTASGRSTYDPVTSRGRYLQGADDQSDVFTDGFVLDHLPRIRVLARTVSPQGVTPDSGSWTGGYEVVISGTNLSAGVVGDIEWVTLAGVTAQVQSVSGSTQLVVTAGQANVAGLGDVRVFSTSHGETVASNAFEYLRTEQAALVFAPTSPQAYNSTRPLSTTGGSGTGAVSYVVSGGPGTIVGGTSLLVNASTGTVTVVATKAQDDHYFATSATGTVTAVKAPQTITFPNPGLQVVTNTTPITASASSGLPVSLAVVSGAEHLIGPIGPFSPISLGYQSPGLVTLRATQAGDGDWQAAAPVEITFRVRADRVPYADFDGDGKSDLSVFHQALGDWYIIKSALGEVFSINWGWWDTVPVPSDYDGDGKADLAVYDQSAGDWYIVKSAAWEVYKKNWGWSETQPVPGDYDGDGLADLAVYHQALGDWYIIQSSDGEVRTKNWGWWETVPVPGDYDGDGLTDLAVYHQSSGDWYIIQSTDGSVRIKNWGWLETTPVPGDYDGDGLTDLAVYHQASGDWHIIQSKDGSVRIKNWGWWQTMPVPGDYDGDGIDDLAVYYQGQGLWYIIESTTGNAHRDINWGWNATDPPWSAWR